MTRRVFVALVVASLAALPGCTTSPPQWFGFTSGAYANDLPMVSVQNGLTLESAFSTAIYRYIDPTAADMYLTDMPVSSVAADEDGGAPRTLEGSVLHIHLFLIPSAGSTPIEPTACNAAIRQFVFNGQGGMGIYAGGAFVVPATDTLGRKTLAGVMRGGSLRLIQATPGFVDALGPSTIRGTFSTQLDDQAGRALAQRLAILAATTPAIVPAQSDVPDGASADSASPQAGE